MRKAYSIFTPAFDPVSGGIRVMYGLYGHLLARGEIAFLNAAFSVPDNGVSIYPEIVPGNPAGTKTNVRYILATPGTMSSGGIPSPTTEQFKTDSTYLNDKFWVFSEIYNTLGVDSDHILFLPILNLKLFADQHKKRTKSCFLIGKGINTWKHPDNAIELTRQFASDQQALADLLNECEVLYCYDRCSAMMEIARLCGVRVVYLGNFSKEELAKYEPGLNGITYRDEKTVPLDTLEFRSHYQHLIDKFHKDLDRFIEETQA